jgi:hypothetical protein
LLENRRLGLALVLPHELLHVGQRGLRRGLPLCPVVQRAALCVL